MAFVRATQKRSFSLNHPVDIPRRLTEYTRGDRTLFVAITKASYVNVGQMGAEFVRLFEDGMSIKTALGVLLDKYGKAKEPELLKALSDLLIQIETRGFYQHAAVSEDSLQNVTMLARLTNRCNLRCSHCLVSSSPEWPTVNDLSTQMWQSTIEEYAQFVKDRGYPTPRVTFTGGEALSRLDAFDILSHSKALGLATELYTNGVLIVNSRIASKIAATADEVQISFDGATAAVHDQVRGTGMFERSVRGVTLLAEAGVRFRISVVVMPQNYQDLMDNLPSLIRRLGNGFNVRLGLAVQEGRATRSMLFSSVVEAEAKIKTLLIHLSREAARSERPFAPNLKTISCGYAREITVNSDGLVFGCGPQVHPIGNLRTEGFRAIAERTIAKSKQAEVDQVEGCKECDIRYVCGGVCRIRNLSKTGSATISSCDRANKERNILRLFGRSSDLIPLTVLANSAPGTSPQSSINSESNFVPLSVLSSAMERRVQ